MPSVLLAMPMMRGQLEPETIHSLMAARRHLYSSEITHNLTSTASSVISASRNAITQEFLNHIMADYLMWIDSDMKFPPYGVNRLMSRNLDIVGGVYHRKEASARPLVFKYHESGKFSTMLDYPTNQLFEVDGIGTGFLLIKRRVLEHFTPELTKIMGAPFNVGINPVGEEEGEDLSFCRRIKKLGYKVWADPTIPLGHIGSFDYNRSKFLEAQKFTEWMNKKTFYKNEIEGWMTINELTFLNDAAKNMDTIVEVGSWKGRSTDALLAGCPGTVYAVDTWKGSDNELDGPHKEATERDIFEDFMKNVGHYENLKPMRMDSIEASKQFEDKSIDMVFIDGNHTYGAVKADIEAWLPKAKKLICGHDFFTFSVQEAVTEKFGEPDTADSIWVRKL